MLRKLQMNERELERMEERAEAAELYVHFYEKCISALFATRMWANAQRDGRPAEHRWRPLFNAAKFG